MEEKEDFGGCGDDGCDVLNRMEGFYTSLAGSLRRLEKGEGGRFKIRDILIKSRKCIKGAERHYYHNHPPFRCIVCTL